MESRTALVFSGIGTQWPGMARELLAADPVFRAAVAEADAALSAWHDWSVTALLAGEAVSPGGDRPDVAHAAIFALQYGLTQCLRDRGTQPVAVIGHSGGEVAAAVAAGLLGLEDGVRVVAAQCALIRALEPGAMLHVATDRQTLASRIAALAEGERLELAALNSGQALVVSGSPTAIAALDAALAAHGLETRLLGIGVPFHTRAVEPHLPAFGKALAPLRPQPAARPIYSSLRGGLAQAGDFDAAYWMRHIRQPVDFAAAARALLAAGIDRCIEVSPHPVLLQHLAAIAAENGQAPALEPTLQRGQGRPAWEQPQAAAPLEPAALAAALQHALTETLEQACDLDALRQLTWSEIGCGSLQLVRLMDGLSARLGRALSVTLPYRFTTPEALLAGLAQQPEQDAAPARRAHSREEPVAVIGMACRFPGDADHPAALWELLARGTDPVTAIPADRWPADAWYDADRAAPGRSVSRWGGFIASQDLREFDARHFRMTPREASALDPQQRLLLEVTWEALENAGLRPAALKGRRVGVYVGVSTDDYKNATLYQDISTLDPYAGAGAMVCTAAGRLSYFFGWAGPSMAIDTACSSSLVALHLGCQALRAGECDIAVVGGVNALLTPHLYVYFSKAGIMSPTGRCHVFDAAADGYVRAEGCGILVLQREPDALREGQRPRARVLGSAVNQDGASTSFSTPSGAAQTSVLRQAWSEAGIDGYAIGYLEAHGTGTAIGDPIELEAMAQAVAPLRDARDPVLVGSVKSNLGHLEAAAGAASLVKTVLALERGELPANLHLQQPNPHVDWARLPLRVVDRHQPWPLRAGRRIAGISSFGFSGTNAHAVLEAVPAADARANPRPVQVLSLSAPDRTTLQRLARQYARRAAALDAAALADLACSTHLARPRLASRLAVAGSPTEIADALAAWADHGTQGERLFAAEGDAGPLVFAFSGQGCQYPGMAAALYRDEPVFRAVLDRCEAVLVGLRGEGMLQLLLDANADAGRLAATSMAQPAIYAEQCALVALLAAWGIRPDRVVGHSVGEFAAAVAAGVLSLEDGLALVVQRADLMAAAPSGGAMAAVAVDEASALAALAGEADRVALAAVNGARSVVLSGAADALATVLARLGPAGAKARRLEVSHAYHSPAMASAAEAFARVEAPAQKPASVTWISSVDGSLLSEAPPDMAYWSRQIRQPVRFHAVLSALEAGGCQTFVEIGPAAVLTALGRSREDAVTRCWIPAQDRRRDGALAMACALAALAAHGVAVDFAAWDPPAGRHRADLPPYPFQRRKHWREPVLPRPASAAVADASAGAGEAPYAWLSRYALARLAHLLAGVQEVTPAWQRHLASCRALLAQAQPGTADEAQWNRERTAFQAAHPSLAGALQLLEDCLAAYPAILAGRTDPLTVLFPQGSMDRVESVYARNEVQEGFNQQLAAAAAHHYAQHQAAFPGRPLRILEIGAGTGATTAAVLAALPAGAAIDYLFTDIGPAFLARARARFPQARFALLDIERHPQRQGLAAGCADLLIAANVLHATADIAQSLAHVQWLAAPGALLLLHEQTVLQPFIHLIFGLTAGWWRFRDQRAMDTSPLLSRPAWLQLLQQAGFGATPTAADEQSGQTIFVAQSLKEQGMAAPTTSASHDQQAATQRVAAIVCELTGLDGAELDPQASLLDLGLDSLMLVQLKALLASRCKLEVEMADFYGDMDSVARLAAAVPAMAPVPAAEPAPVTVQMVQPRQPELPVEATRPQPVRAAATGELAHVMALQLEAMSRLVSEQNALLAAAQQAAPAAAARVAPAPAVQATSGQHRPIPNFRSIKRDADAFTPAQQDFVADLARRYAARTPSSKALADSSRHTLADWKNTLSFRQSLKEMMYPIVAARSRGSHFTDLDGNDFLDLTMGCGIGLLGHSPEPVVQALHAQVDAGFAIGPQTALAADVAQRFARLTGMERVTFCNTGAEAVMMAVRLARARTGRDKLVIFSGAYHGTWDGVLGVDHEGAVHPMPGGIPAGMVQDLVILNYGTDEALATLRGIAGEVAAVLVEPVQSRRPGFHPAAFLRELRAITERSGSALIFDEMITGLRIAPGGGQAHFGVRADLATYGKIVGGGMPLSIVAGSAAYMDGVDGGPWRFGDDSGPGSEVIYFGGTYVKHPLALAAARAALEHIETLGDAAYEDLNRRSDRLADTLNAWFAAEAVPLAVAHFGSLFRIEGSGRYSAMMQPVELDLLFLLLILRGVYVWERRICFLSFAHTDAEVDQVVRCVQEAVRELRGGGFAFGTSAAAARTADTEVLAAVARVGPTTSAQRRMFALAEIDGPSVVYNVPLAVRLRGPLDLPRLEQSIAALVARHGALRTRFTVTDDALLQRIEPAASVALERIACSPASLAHCLEAFVQPFDLTRAPLMRAGLLQLAPEHHVLVIDAHHIVADGLTLNILARELMASHAGEPLPPSGPDMIDCAQAEAGYLASAACERDGAWWQERFRSLPEPLQLPLDRPRPLRRRHRGADLTARLDTATTARLLAAAREHRMPLFPLLLALYAALLHRLAAQDEIVIGLPVGGRGEPRFRDTVGMLAAVLPLRLASQPALALADAARACHREFLAALDHQGYPLDALIAGLDLPRDTSRNPLFDTMFIYEDGNDRVYRMQGLDCTDVPVSRRAAMFDLSMEVVQAQGELALRLEYDTDLFEPGSAQALLDAYLRLLEGAPGSMRQPLGELELVDDDQRRQLLAWGDGGPASTPRTVLQLFDHQLRRQPDAIALVAGEQALSYRELDRRSRRMAHALRSHGTLAADTPVALVAHRDAGLLVGMLAILRAGAAYLPLEPAHPLERTRLVLQASSCRLALAAPDLVAQLAAVEGLQVVSLDGGDSGAPQEPPPVEVAIAPEQLANLLFTSGSTGVPKGVMVRHRNLAAFFEALPASFGFAPGRRILALTTPTFDIAGLELVGALCCGMTVVLASERESGDAGLLLALMERERVDVAQLTPTRLRLLTAGAGVAALSGLRTLLVGGEALPPELAGELLALPETQVFNVYGPTETTIWSTLWPLAAGPVRLGRPFPGEQLYLLSPRQRLQPAGAIGEIAIGGAGVARGYIGDPARSAERFASVPGIDGPVYLTGDLGRWHADGSLEYLGRRDEQVKLRGMRIETGEIEHQLRRLPGVREAAAAVQPGPLGDKEIVGYLVGPSAEPDTAALRDALSAWLPPAMVPARFVVLHELPRTANGKTDRRALPAPQPALATAPRRLPEGPLETAITSAFAEVLGRELGPDDDFFLSGGESIRALRLAGRIRALGLAFELHDLFQWPTPARLARHLQAAAGTAPGDATPAPPGALSGLGAAELEELLA